MSGYVDFLSNHFGGKNWVIARRTPNILARYGEDVICLSRKRYKEAERAWRELYGDPYDEARAELYLAAKALCEARPTNAEDSLWYRLRDALKAEVAFHRSASTPYVCAERIRHRR